jgi:hypothetical protein
LANDAVVESGEPLIEVTKVQCVVNHCLALSWIMASLWMYYLEASAASYCSLVADIKGTSKGMEEFAAFIRSLQDSLSRAINSS